MIVCPRCGESCSSATGDLSDGSRIGLNRVVENVLLSDGQCGGDTVSDIPHLDQSILHIVHEIVELVSGISYRWVHPNSHSTESVGTDVPENVVIHRRDRSNVAHAFQHVGVAVVVEILHNIV